MSLAEHKAEDNVITFARAINFEACVIKFRRSDIKAVDRPMYQIDAEQLHMFLDVSMPFRQWVALAVQKWGYGMEDYCPMHKPESKRRANYILSLNMAAELAAMEYTDRGVEARKQIRMLQQREAIWRRNSQQEQAFNLLTDPRCRKFFIDKLAERGKFSDFDPMLQTEYLANIGCLTADQERDQRIINVLVFTPEILMTLRKGAVM